MLCGVAGIDVVLFVVALDDGPMPQTREHLAILDLLAIPRGVVALTKKDRVSPQRVKEVAEQVQTLVVGTILENAEVFAVSATTGDGLKTLWGALERATISCPTRSSAGNFRMPIDRCFTMAGAGLVVTGTAISGSIEVGNPARLLLAGVPVRVRAIHAQNTPSRTGYAGQRCALNLTGTQLNTNRVDRGDWIVTGDVPAAARKLDARLKILATEHKPFAHWTSAHVHLGAGHTIGRVVVLEGKEISPGASALVQLIIDRPLGGVCGDRFIIRDQSARRTVGGGRIIDVFPPGRGRTKPERIAFLRAMEQDDDRLSLELLIEQATQGLNLSKFAANRNLTAEEVRGLITYLSPRSVITESALLGFSPRRWAELKSHALDQLMAWHRRAPDKIGLAADRIFSESKARVPRQVVAALIAELISEGAVVKRGPDVRLNTHKPELNPADAALWRKILLVFHHDGLRPLSILQIATAIGEELTKIEMLLARAVDHGLVVRLSQNRFIRPSSLRRLAEIAEETARASTAGLVTAAEFRDRSEIGRNLTIEVLEYFDRIKFTRRIGDAHLILRHASATFDDA
jgi:selenocysteine-specific elongation factor